VGTPTEEKPAEEEPPPAQEPAAYSQETFDALFTNIATSYAGTSEDWKALELAAIDKADSADQDKIILGAVAAYEEPDTTNLQRSILSLTALGIDATNVESEDTRYNLIEALGKAQIAHNTANGKMFALLAYASGPYTPEADALRTTEQLVSDVLALQNADGGWSFTGSTSDADMIGIAIAALAPYRSDNAAVEEAIQTGLSTLRAMQLPTGGFASLYTPGEIDVSSTAMAIIALSAADIDAQTWIYTAPTEAQSNVKALSSRAAASDDSLLLAAADTPAATPLNDLLSLANESQDGFLYDGKTNDMATEQGFRALVAYQGFKNTKAAFNVYTQAASGLAAQEPAATEPEPKPEEEPKPTEKPNTPDNTDDADNDATDDSGALPATGDDSYVILLMLAFIVLCALACTVRYARLRRKKSVEEMTRAE
jgi:hypothetical protein